MNAQQPSHILFCRFMPGGQIAMTALGLMLLSTAQGQLRSDDDQIWTQDGGSSGYDLPDDAEERDRFGAALATGDFNCDGIEDLAVGAPDEDVYEVLTPFNPKMGSVTVIYGSSSGLSNRESTAQVWHQDSADILDQTQIFERFGAALASGDFDGNGCDDLAIGVPDEDLDNPFAQDAGAVNVIYGSASGLVSDNNQFWNMRELFPSSSSSIDNDNFGAALAAGDFDCDGVDDLAIGVPSAQVDIGNVNVIYGEHGTGLKSSSLQNLFQGQSDGWSGYIKGLPFPGEGFGTSLAAGDFNGDRCDDLAIGVPFDWIAIGPGRFDVCVVTCKVGGAVNVLYGSVGGLSISGASGIPANQRWHQRSIGMKGVAANGDEFGRSLATGDFDGDGIDDLAIGVPGEGIFNRHFPFFHEDAGAVQIIFGSGDGLIPGEFTDLSGTTYIGYREDQRWHQDSGGIKGRSEWGDRFGSSLAVGDFDSDGVDDLAIGVPGENDDGGIVNVLYGASQRGITDRDQVWSQNSADIEGSRENNDHFGDAVAAGDLNNDGADDLAIGVPNESVGPQPQISEAGAVNVIYGKYDGQNRPPEGNAGEDQAVFVGDDCTATVLLDGVGSTDPDGDPITSYTWAIDGELFYGQVQEITFGKGLHTASLVVSDGYLESEPDEVVVAVEDGSVPAGNLSFTPNSLWPPNGKMVPVDVNIDASDNCDSSIVVELEAVTAWNGNAADISGVAYDTDDRSFFLRAARPGTMKDGVLYEVTYSLTDSSENSALVHGTVSVPHDNGKRPESAGKTTTSKK